ncbi:UNVERIFIED_CONTAM: hypothetical protein Sradi_2765500 [Sesamum radiatum]|uniref:Uncharacterized protein n=1 Tax=Sesamum radiatum TaxID=300843 RepID=A0AAW2S9W4_SESRA
MVQLSALFNTFSKNITSGPGKKSRHGVGREAAIHLAKEAKRHELLLTASGVATARNQKNFAAYSKQGKKGLNQDRFIVWQDVVLILGVWMPRRHGFLWCFDGMDHGDI